MRGENPIRVRSESRARRNDFLPFRHLYVLKGPGVSNLHGGAFCPSDPVYSAIGRRRESGDPTLSDPNDRAPDYLRRAYVDTKRRAARFRL